MQESSGTEPRSDRNNVIFLIDYVTIQPSIKTERVAEALVVMFSRVCVPDEMLSDCGSQFTSKFMKEVSRLLSLQQVTSTIHHQIYNGLVERFHAT